MDSVGLRTRASATWAVDVAMLALALVSVGLLTYVTFFDVDEEAATVVFVVDAVVCGVFAVEFLWRWRAAGWTGRFPLRHWYEVLGMIPLAHPALRGFRLLRVVAVISRLARTTDRVLGERATQRLVERFSRPIVAAIKKPVTVAVLDEVAKVLETGRYPHNIARSVDEHRELLRDLVTEKVKNDPQAGKLSRLPFGEDVLRSVVDTTIRVILDVLTDPRADVFFTHAVRENQRQIRSAVASGLHERDA
ncbi:ion transporter [Saccharomonospora sp. NB11]|uniref:ion transporter n=1 Tax=Saccharomonospora sp. NB11 TaxID=1642298 RepID=UPI001E50D535|nr:ion transporter [Saccharomonospora sp. NB11]